MKLITVAGPVQLDSFSGLYEVDFGIFQPATVPSAIETTFLGTLPQIVSKIQEHLASASQFAILNLFCTHFPKPERTELKELVMAHNRLRVA